MKGYTFRNYDREHMARAIGITLPISFKQSVEICKFVKNKNVGNAKKLLQEVIDRKTPMPFTRYNGNISHKTKAGPARYPAKAPKEIIKLLEGVEANAQFKGLNTSNLIISHISAHKSPKAWHYGRKPRRIIKRTNIEVVVEEKHEIKGRDVEK